MPPYSPPISAIVTVQIVTLEGLAHVRFGSKADMCTARSHVRFPPIATSIAFFGMSALCKKLSYVLQADARGRAYEYIAPADQVKFTDRKRSGTITQVYGRIIPRNMQRSPFSIISIPLQGHTIITRAAQAQSHG